MSPPDRTPEAWWTADDQPGQPGRSGSLGHSGHLGWLRFVQAVGGGAHAGCLRLQCRALLLPYRRRWQPPQSEPRYWHWKSGMRPAELLAGSACRPAGGSKTRAIGGRAVTFAFCVFVAAVGGLGGVHGSWRLGYGRLSLGRWGRIRLNTVRLVGRWWRVRRNAVLGGIRCLIQRGDRLKDDGLASQGIDGLRPGHLSSGPGVLGAWKRLAGWRTGLPTRASALRGCGRRLRCVVVRGINSVRACGIGCSVDRDLGSGRLQGWRLRGCLDLRRYLFERGGRSACCGASVSRAGIVAALLPRPCPPACRLSATWPGSRFHSIILAGHRLSWFGSRSCCPCSAYLLAGWPRPDSTAAQRAMHRPPCWRPPSTGADGKIAGGGNPGCR